MNEATRRRDPETPRPTAGASRSWRDRFHHFAAVAATVLGSPWAFVIACLVVGTWLLSGPLFHFSDTWQLVINTATTIVTFLMVFLIQNTQNRDAKALHLKLDELVRANRRARNALIDLEDLSEGELRDLEREFRELRSKQPRRPPGASGRQPPDA
jgi:low affinity Fe/Cu permease